ncbi:hypothetical protein [Microcoleus sp. CAWBG58]|uniref:hypothetical protein n=1 Tax=Microcoleus sp. CAWBG58 TaxID=2841651 RepID=UPI0025E488BB|nr:hypothetical protein [Microcoleus sp. CAWBG58]
MGYTTIFDGRFHLNKRLLDIEVIYLIEFSRTRRMKRNAAILQSIPDPARQAVNLPVGEEGCYFVNQSWDEESEVSIVNYNRPPKTQPGLWCKWIPTADGGGIKWNGMEKFYDYVEWLQYLIDNFIEPWGYLLSGEVNWQGEREEDVGTIWVENNVIISPEDARELLRYAVSPVSVPKVVWDCLQAVEASGKPLTHWHELIDRAIELGHGEAVLWINPNMDKYLDGCDRGFEFEGEVIESIDEDS